MHLSVPQHRPRFRRCACDHVALTRLSAEMKLTDWLPAGSDWWAVAFFAFVGAVVIAVSQWPSGDARDRDPAFFSLRGAACGRFLTADEKLEWERLDMANAKQMANSTCQQLAAMLDIYSAPKVESAAGDCFSQMNSLENDVWSTLSWHSTTRLDRLPCGSERRVLDMLANVPHEYRDEQVDRLFDRALGR